MVKTSERQQGTHFPTLWWIFKMDLITLMLFGRTEESNIDNTNVTVRHNKDIITFTVLGGEKRHFHT